MLSRTLWGAMLLLVPLSVFAQTSPPRKARPALPVTGLKVASATMDTATHDITVQLQNTTTDKTAVAYLVRIRELDVAGKEINDIGSMEDFAEPDNQGAANFVEPGQILRHGIPYRASPDAASVEVTVTGVVYEDRTVEGLSQGFFLTRERLGRAAREQASQEQGARKQELERRAAWYETHGPKEAQQ